MVLAEQAHDSDKGGKTEPADIDAGTGAHAVYHLDDVDDDELVHGGASAVSLTPAHDPMVAAASSARALW